VSKAFRLEHAAQSWAGTTRCVPWEWARAARSQAVRVAEVLRAEALRRTRATIRAEFTRADDVEVEALAAVLLRDAPMRTEVQFWRERPEDIYCAVFGRLRHPAGAEAFYVSRIE
jgi:hypothetical protein